MTLQGARNEATVWFRAFLESVPGEIGCFLRRRLYGFSGAPGSRVLDHVKIHFPERLVLGRNAGISAYSQLNAAGGITIGDNVLIGPGAKLWSQNHRFVSSDPIINQGYDRAPIMVERDAWLAAGVIVLPGVVIAEGTVVAAGAVVTKSTEPFSIVGGVPAKQIGTRISQREQLRGA